MSPKFFIEALDSPSMSNSSKGGALPQIRPGEKRVGTSRTTAGKTSTPETSQRTNIHKKPERRARLVYRNGVIVVEYD